MNQQEMNNKIAKVRVQVGTVLVSSNDLCEVVFYRVSEVSEKRFALLEPINSEFLETGVIAGSKSVGKSFSRKIKSYGSGDAVQISKNLKAFVWDSHIKWSSELKRETK
jgi:hypothetical protein